MATAKIIWYKGAAYHITTRGNHRNDIFKDEEDFQVYLTQVEENFDYYNYLSYQLIAYCLMDNHVHLIIKTDKEPLTRFMRRLNSIYTKYFNKKYNYIGHLFQDKYFSELIEDDKQMLETSRYVHLNPVKANMVEKPEEYKWSSYSMFIGKSPKKLVSSEIILSYFNNKYKHKLYEEFVECKLQNKEQGDEFDSYSS
jgi:REP element-mobilizing transposase RayT